MALQVKGGDPRLFNPDRDMIWALPRLVRVALQTMGKDISVETLRKFMDARGIQHDQCDDDELYVEFESFLRDLAKFFNELKDSAAVRENPTDWFKRLLSGPPVSNIRVLVADLMMCAMFAELPIWFESIQPKQANSPVPNVEEVERAVEAVLRRHVDGEGSAND